MLKGKISEKIVNGLLALSLLGMVVMCIKLIWADTEAAEDLIWKMIHTNIVILVMSVIINVVYYEINDY